MTFEVDGTAAHLVVADGALDAARGACRRRAGHRARRHRMLGAVPGRGVDLRVGHARPRAGAAPAGDQFVAWEPALRAAIDGRRCTSPGRSGSRTATATSSTCAGPSASTTPARTSATSSPKRATCTSKGCSPNRRWPRCRRSSTRRWPRRRGTTARRGGRAPRRAGTRRASSGFNLKSPTLQELLESDRFTRIGGLTDDAMVQRDREKVTPPKDCQEGRRARRHLRRVVAQGLLDGRPLAAVLWPHRRHLDHRRASNATASSA